MFVSFIMGTAKERAGPYAGAPPRAPGAPKLPALELSTLLDHEPLDNVGPLDKIMAKLTTMGTNQATKADIAGLETKEELHSEIEESKKWETGKFATKQDHDNL